MSALVEPRRVHHFQKRLILRMLTSATQASAVPVLMSLVDETNGFAEARLSSSTILPKIASGSCVHSICVNPKKIIEYYPRVPLFLENLFFCIQNWR